MNYAVDIIVVILILLGTYLGWRKGLIKSLVSVIGLVAIFIISFAIKDKIANILIDNLPFFSLPGLEGLTSINVLLYNVIAFLVIFILLYCLLNIIIAITGFVDTLLKFTVIWIIPSKIGGAIVGFIESWVFVYLALFVISLFSVTAGFVWDGKVSSFILNHTPVINRLTGGAKTAINEITDAIEEFRNDSEKTTEDLNLRILQIEIVNGVISKEKAQELIDTGKVELDNIYFGEGNKLWLDI